MQAYIGERVPYRSRGTAVGIIEMSFAGSSLLGIPMIGIAIDRFGWQSPFFVLFGFGLLGILALACLVPPDDRSQSIAAARYDLIGTFRHLLRERSVLGALGFSFFIAAANDNLFVVYGAWLEASFGLSVFALGIATTTIGGAELLGEILTASVGDRMGLFRLVVICTILAALSYAALPYVGQTLPLALTALFLVFTFFECAIVTAISLYTEILPNARATMMSGHLAAASIGRMVGALVGGPVWLFGGIASTGVVSAAVTALAMGSLIWGLRDWRPIHEP